MEGSVIFFRKSVSQVVRLSCPGSESVSAVAGLENK